MDPISAIFVMVVLTGAFAKGVDVATDGLLSAEVGGGVRGVSHYAVQAGKARWRLANAKAREIRTQSPQGRKVQEILDLAGMFVRVLSGEAVRFGSGVRSSWRSGREQERSVRTERRGDAPWPVTQWLLERAERTRTRLAERAERARTATPDEDPNGASSGPEPEPNTTTAADPNGDPGDIWQDPPVIGTVCPPTGRRLCERCGERPWTTQYLDPWSMSLDATLGRPLHICDQCAREIEAERNGDPGDYDEPNGDPNTPVGATPNAPAMKGTIMDINSAPAAIDAWEAFAPRWESLQSQADALQGEIDSLTNEAAALHGEIATLADGMGDFAVGGEADTAAAVGELSDAAASAKEKADALAAAIGTAKQAVDSHVDRLHDDFDASIEAAAGQNADAHAVMQEA